jgi:hypothetical protein
MNGTLARMGEGRSAYKFIAIKPEGRVVIKAVTSAMNLFIVHMMSSFGS